MVGQDGRASRPFIGLGKRCRGRCLRRHRRRGPVRGVNSAIRSRECASIIESEGSANGEQNAVTHMKTRLDVIRSVRKLGVGKVKEIWQQGVDQRAVGQ